MEKQISKWKVAALPALALITAFGCSDDSDLFAGMWNFDEDEPFHSAGIEGILQIEGPCVYVIDDYAWLLPGTLPEELPEPIRIFVNLPRQHTRYDTSAGSIWINNNGPITSGDRVELIGGGISPSLPDVCSADVDRVFNVKSMAFKPCRIWFPIDHWSQSGCHPSVTDPLAGLWGPGASMAALLEGLLLIEWPCVYVIGDYVDWTPEERPEPELGFIHLPRGPTRYDPDTGSIWIHDEGPMVSGDRVELSGGGWGLDSDPSDDSLPNRIIPEVCSADVDYRFIAASMSPKR